MIEIPALIAILVAETLILLVGVLVFQEYRKSRKRQHDRMETSRFIERINLTQRDRLGDLCAALLNHNLGTDFQACRENLEEIIRSEKLLYRQFFDAYLNHDSARIKALDGLVRDLTIPYCRLAKQLQDIQMENMVDVETQKEIIVDLETRLHASLKEVDQLKSQLSLATTSLRDISEEYTQMFGSYKGVSQVQDSLDRVLDIFRLVEKRSAALDTRPATEVSPAQDTESPA